jgi:parallel beta-helix repeat protein
MFSLFFLILAPLNIAGALEHSGTISKDETWFVSDNPHEITGNVTINNLATVTLEPGVEVLFKGNYWIGTYGTLAAQGQQNNRIRFTRAPGVANWYGLYFYQGSAGVFSYCTVEWASQRGISAEGAYLSVTNSIIRHNYYGIYASTIDPNLTDNLIENNIIGLNIYNYSYPPVAEAIKAAGGVNNIFRDNDTGLLFQDCIRPKISETAVIENNRKYGVHFQGCSHPGLLTDITRSGTAVYYQNCVNVSPLTGISMTDNAGPYGAIFTRGSGQLTLGTGNIITGNSYPLSIDVESYGSAESLIPIAGNDTNAIQVTSGTGQESTTWYDFGIPYALTQSPTVGASGSLTVDAGVEVRLNNGVSLSVYGELQTNGTSENGIIFSRNQIPIWGYLAFYPGSIATLTFTTIEFANYGVYVQTAAPELDSCSLKNNTQGYYGYVDATSSIHDCVVMNNDYGIRLSYGSDPIISQNSIKQNRLWGVYNDDYLTVTVDCENNFWGDAIGPRHSSNPGGRGDLVSDGVDFDPWLTSDPS